MGSSSGSVAADSVSAQALYGATGVWGCLEGTWRGMAGLGGSSSQISASKETAQLQGAALKTFPTWNNCSTPQTRAALCARLKVQVELEPSD